MSELFPSPYTVVHIPRAHSTTKDSHGNNPVVAGAPVVRKAQSINQLGKRGSSKQIFSNETASREETTLQMAVADPQSYKSGDQVLLDATVDSGNYVAGTGIAFVVDGDPTDERLGPWPEYLKYFGGIVRLRRVT